jgi:hypothetical protein
MPGPLASTLGRYLSRFGARLMCDDRHNTGCVQIEVNGCDFYTFRDGKITKKDSYWKIVEV